MSKLPVEFSRERHGERSRTEVVEGINDKLWCSLLLEVNTDSATAESQPFQCVLCRTHKCEKWAGRFAMSTGIGTEARRAAAVGRRSSADTRTGPEAERSAGLRVHVRVTSHKA